mmetsp:Transcript_27244/g.51881  ORF Transcript_27244/g.51881 Transcript_27244/m.51881 type:complete len:214 (-) Transcript_27244:1336-1977(-)
MAGGRGKNTRSSSLSSIDARRISICCSTGFLTLLPSRLESCWSVVVSSGCPIFPRGSPSCQAKSLHLLLLVSDCGWVATTPDDTPGDPSPRLLAASVGISPTCATGEAPIIFSTEFKIWHDERGTWAGTNRSSSMAVTTSPRCLERSTCNSMALCAKVDTEACICCTYSFIVFRCSVRSIISMSSPSSATCTSSCASCAPTTMRSASKLDTLR